MCELCVPLSFRQAESSVTVKESDTLTWRIPIEITLLHGEPMVVVVEIEAVNADQAWTRLRRWWEWKFFGNDTRPRPVGIRREYRGSKADLE